MSFPSAPILQTCMKMQNLPSEASFLNKILTFYRTCRLQDSIIHWPIEIFLICKKFLVPCDPNIVISYKTMELNSTAFSLEEDIAKIYSIFKAYFTSKCPKMTKKRYLRRENIAKIIYYYTWNHFTTVLAK